MRCLLIAIFLVGCASSQVNRRLDEYKAYFDPRLKIATKEQIAGKFGPPYKESVIGKTTLWQYHLSFGTTGNILTSEGVGVSNRWEQYDDITLQFDSLGILKKWNVRVQR